MNGQRLADYLGHIPDFAASHSNLPLLAAYEMRNAIAHGYFAVDFDIVWKTIQNDLSDLQQQVERLKHELAKSLE
ncbi:MAG: DUF86 domain-containing protein [Acidobacteriaceae bacterium]|nr:DUF86 domain-containing protein [Acidobacteriaceae bacterium]